MDDKQNDIVEEIKAISVLLSAVDNSGTLENDIVSRIGDVLWKECEALQD